MSLCSNILFGWERSKVKLDHDYAITECSFSVMPEVRANVKDFLNGEHRDSIEHVVSKLHEPLCPNKSNKIQVKTMGEILHMLWLESKHFQKKTRPFNKHPRCFTSAALTDRSHIWRELYFLAYMEVLGFVACRTNFKPLLIGACEKSWVDVKHIKTGKRSHMGQEYTKKRAVLYTILSF